LNLEIPPFPEASANYLKKRKMKLHGLTAMVSSFSSAKWFGKLTILSQSKGDKPAKLSHPSNFPYTTLETRSPDQMNYSNRPSRFCSVPA